MKTIKTIFAIVVALVGLYAAGVRAETAVPADREVFQTVGAANSMGKR